MMTVHTPTRRDTLKWISAAGLVSLNARPFAISATQTDMQATIKEIFGTQPIQDGKIDMRLPALSENGYFVKLDVSVDSPMQQDNYVQKLAIFSERNPIPLIAQYYFTPHSGRARVSTQIRLSGTQTVHAIAQLNDGSLWGGAAETIVTLAACIIL